MKIYKLYSGHLLALLNVVTHNNREELCYAISKDFGTPRNDANARYEGMRTVRYTRFVFSTIGRIARNWKDVICVEKHWLVGRAECSRDNICDCVIDMHNVIEGAIDADLCRDINTTGALQRSSIKAMPNLFTIGFRGCNAFSICKAEEPNHTERHDSAGRSGS